MKYITPEIEIVDLDMLDVIATSGDTTKPTNPVDPDPGNNGLPIL